MEAIFNKQATSRMNRLAEKHPKKYRFYFFDYLYYKTERWSEKTLRCSGSFMIWWFWWWDVALASSFLIPLTWGNSIRYSLYASLFAFPLVLTPIRYRKGRRSVIMKHYRSKNSGGTMLLLFVLSFVLFFLEMWVLEKWGFVIGKYHYW